VLRLMTDRRKAFEPGTREGRGWGIRLFGGGLGGGCPGSHVMRNGEKKTDKMGANERRRGFPWNDEVRIGKSQAPVKRSGRQGARQKRARWK